ncbi:unnamed protein product [Arctogadus glacialis]
MEERYLLAARHNMESGLQAVSAQLKRLIIQNAAIFQASRLPTESNIFFSPMAGGERVFGVSWEGIREQGLVSPSAPPPTGTPRNKRTSKENPEKRRRKPRRVVVAGADLQEERRRTPKSLRDWRSVRPHRSVANGFSFHKGRFLRGGGAGCWETFSVEGSKAAVGRAVGRAVVDLDDDRRWG